MKSENGAENRADLPPLPHPHLRTLTSQGKNFRIPWSFPGLPEVPQGDNELPVTGEVQAETQEGTQAPGRSLDQRKSVGGPICPQPRQEAER